MSDLNRREFLVQAAAVGAGSMLVGWQGPGVGLRRGAPARFTRSLQKKDVPEEIEPIDAPFEMPDLGRPTFPERTFDVREYGAEPGGTTLNTQPIAEAIRACHEKGGGRVLIPEGEWLTGPIHLRSNVNLRVAKGAHVRFSDDREEYLPVVHTRHEGVEVYNYSPLIYAPHCTNVAITGQGTLDGNGERWWEWAENNDDQYIGRNKDAQRPLDERTYGEGTRGLRPSFVQPWKSRNVLVEGVTLTRTPFWAVHPVYCENVVVRDVHIQTLDAPNGDGVNPDSCRNVLVEYCHLKTGDDAVTLKSGLNEDGRRVDRPTENAVVRHIDARAVRTGSGGVVIGSEISGGVRNVYAHDCFFEGADRGVRLKSERGRGAVVENLYVHDVEMRDIDSEAIRINSYYSEGEATGLPPSFRNIDIRNVSVDGAETGVELIGLPEEFIRNVRMENLRIQAETGLRCTRIDGLVIADGTVEAEEGPVVALSDCRDAMLRWLALTGPERLLRVDGEETRNVRIDESIPDGKIELGDAVVEGAVTHVD